MEVAVTDTEIKLFLQVMSLMIMLCRTKGDSRPRLDKALACNLSETMFQKR